MRRPRLFFGRRRWWAAGLLFAVLAWPTVVGVAWLRVAVDGTEPSHAVGSWATGHLEGGHVIPPWGPGWRTASYLGAALGRQYVHGAVRDALLAALTARAAAQAGRIFVIGETGWPSGGRFRPHRTHANGLSVDLFMPMVDGAGRAAALATGPWNRFGYGIEIDAQGRLGDDRVDFEALAALLGELERQSSARRLVIAQVIIAPEFVPLLLATPSGALLGPLAEKLWRKPAWVRHDEHVHVDFRPL